MSTPTVSVLMPVYNARPYVAEAVKSILAQTFTDFEFIIVDDGSTDGSTEILQSFAKQDSRIHFISRPNTGLVKALNEGIEYCRGEFIARMDADDISNSMRFEKQVAHLRANATCVVVGANWERIDPDGDVLRPALKTLPLTHQEIDCQLLARRNYIAHPATMMRASTLRQVGGYRQLAVGEDADLWLRLGELGELCNLPDTLIQYRLLLSSLSRTRLDSDIISAIIAEAHKRRQLSGDIHAVPVRQSKSPSDIGDNGLFYVYQAIRGKQWRTARKHAIRQVVKRPLSLRSWKLLTRTLMRLSPYATY